MLFSEVISHKGPMNPFKLARLCAISGSHPTQRTDEPVFNLYSFVWFQVIPQVLQKTSEPVLAFFFPVSGSDPIRRTDEFLPSGECLCLWTLRPDWKH